MQINKPRTFPEVLADQDNPQLSGLIRRGRQLHGLRVLLGKLLGEELSAHCQLANIKGNTLVLAASSTAWATRVRYQTPQLLQKIRLDERFSGIGNIHVHITPPESSINAPRQIRRATMSEAAASCINQCAEGIDDPRLSSALQHLAKKKRSGNNTT